MPVVSRVIFSFIGANEAVPRDLHQPNVCGDKEEAEWDGETVRGDGAAGSHLVLLMLDLREACQ